MTTLREAAQMALDALEEAQSYTSCATWSPSMTEECAKVAEALRAALAQPEREWQGLTDQNYEAMAQKYVTNCYFDTLKYARAIEARLREKNS